VKADALLHLHDAASLGTGIAGTLNQGISTIPLIGGLLAGSTIAPIVASAIIGIGGVMFANWLEKHETGTSSIRWSSIIRTAALTTSVLVTLPSILTGVTTGLSYLALALGDGGATVDSIYNSIGVATGHNSTTSLLGAAVPHLFLCGASLLPVGLAYWMGSRRADPPIIEWVEQTPTESRKTNHLKFRLLDAKTHRPIDPDAMAISHTEKLHAMAVDASLSDYHHVHPKYDQETKSFNLTFTPELPFSYNLVLEFTPKGGHSPTQLHASLPSSKHLSIVPRITVGPDTTPNDTILSFNAPHMQSGQDNTLTLNLTDKQGRPITDLQPIMGADAHLVGFSADGKHMIHAHPMAPAEGGKLSFHVMPETAGPIRFFLQIRRAGQDVTLPFGVNIQQQRTPTTAEKYFTQPAQSWAR